MNKPILAVVAAAVVAGGAWFATQSSEPEQTTNSNVTDAVDVAGDFDVLEMVQGNPESAVEVIEYASYTCPHCAAFHASQYQDLKENYIETGLIRFVYREVYFDQPGLWASMIARCGGEDRFFGISNLLYEDQQGWSRAGDGSAIAAALRNIGKVAGITDEELDACMSDGENAQELMAWYRANAEADQVQGTPSFIINGERYSNMTYDDFAEILDEKLAEAN